jgi:hypothetical protein
MSCNEAARSAMARTRATRRGHRPDPSLGEAIARALKAEGPQQVSTTGLAMGRRTGWYLS